MWVENVCGLIMFTVVEGHGSFLELSLIVGPSRFRPGWCGSFLLDKTWCCSILTATEDIFMKSLAAVSGTSLSCHNCLVETHCGNCHGIQSREETNVLLWSPAAASWRRMKKGKRWQLCGEALKGAKWSSNLRAELPSSITTCSSKNHPALIITPTITPHHHIEHRKNCPELSP